MIKRHPLVIFTLLTFGLTWVVWVPRAAGVPVGTLGQLWTWVPAVAALLAAALTGGREAVVDLLRRLAGVLRQADGPLRRCHPAGVAAGV